MADVTFQRPEYEKSAPRWAEVSVAVEGQQAVKDKRETFLPRPNPADKSPEANERYENYLARAVYYNATGRTLQGLIGAVFSDTPNLEVPTDLEYIQEDMDGAGVSIYQQSQATLEHVLKPGRCGLFVDMPPTEGATTRAKQQALGIFPRCYVYPASSVINWRTESIGGRQRLSLVVISESYEEVTEDGFGSEAHEQFRALKLIDGVYTVELWRKYETGAWSIYESYTPLDGAGRTWEEIPFMFPGSVNNDPGIDPSPLYDMAVINLAHYRNSADYEDSVFFCGQVQPWMSGLDESWVEMLKKEGFVLGSRAIFPVPQGGQFGFEQAQPNTLVKDAMDQKERQMVALGARLIEKGAAVKTATEAQGDNEAEHSVLSLAAQNVSEAYTKALEWMSRFLNITGTVLYQLSQEYGFERMTAQDRAQLLMEWQSGLIAKKDARDALRKSGVIDPERTDEDIDGEVEGETAGLGLDGDE